MWLEGFLGLGKRNHMIPDVIRLIIVYLKPEQMETFFLVHDVKWNMKFAYSLPKRNVLPEFRCIVDRFPNMMVKDVTVRCGAGLNDLRVLFEESGLGGDRWRRIRGINIVPFYDSTIDVSCVGECGDLERFSVDGIEECSVIGADAVEKCRKLKYVDFSMAIFKDFKQHLCINLAHIKMLIFSKCCQSPNIFYCVKFEKLRHIGNICSSGLSKLKDGTNIIATLASVDMMYTNLSDLKKWNKLKCLRVSRFMGTRYLSGLRIKKLILHRSNMFRSLRGLEVCEELESLVLEDCHEIKTLEHLTKCLKLRRIRIIRCSGVENLRGLQGMEYVCIDGCHGLTDVSHLNECTRLKYLEINNCSSLRTLDGIDNDGGVTDHMIVTQCYGIPSPYISI